LNFKFKFKVEKSADAQTCTQWKVATRANCGSKRGTESPRHTRKTVAVVSTWRCPRQTCFGFPQKGQGIETAGASKYLESQFGNV
jgi:hypothetical protein